MDCDTIFFEVYRPSGLADQQMAEREFFSRANLDIMKTQRKSHALLTMEATIPDGRVSEIELDVIGYYGRFY